MSARQTTAASTFGSMLGPARSPSCASSRIDATSALVRVIAHRCNERPRGAHQRAIQADAPTPPCAVSVMKQTVMLMLEGVAGQGCPSSGSDAPRMGVRENTTARLSRVGVDRSRRTTTDACADNRAGTCGWCEGLSWTSLAGLTPPATPLGREAGAPCRSAAETYALSQTQALAGDRTGPARLRRTRTWTPVVVTAPSRAAVHHAASAPAPRRARPGRAAATPS